MPQQATLPTGGSGATGGFENLPTPVKIGLIGGGLGLAFFLWKRASSGGGSSGQPSGQDATSYGIPNTAVMLGSLQQEMMDLKGEYGANTVDIETLLTGGFQNVGSMIDAQTGTFQGALSDLQKNVIDNQNANTQNILDSLSARSDLLQQLIQTSSGAEQAAFQSFADSTAHGLNAITAQQNAEMAAIGALGQNISTGQADLISRIQTLQDTTTGLSSKISSPQYLFQGANLSGIQYIWYQPPGSDQYHASMYKVVNGTPTGIAWSQYVSETGKNYFPGVSGTPVQSGYATVVV